MRTGGGEWRRVGRVGRTVFSEAFFSPCTERQKGGRKASELGRNAAWQDGRRVCLACVYVRVWYVGLSVCIHLCAYRCLCALEMVWKCMSTSRVCRHEKGEDLVSCSHTSVAVFGQGESEVNIDTDIILFVSV